MKQVSSFSLKKESLKKIEEILKLNRMFRSKSHVIEESIDVLLDKTKKEFSGKK